jgi:hypothetical protein
VILTRIVWCSHAWCDVHSHSVMVTRTSVISARKVWFLHAECYLHAKVWFLNVKCDYYIQSVISTCRVLFPHAVWFWNVRLWLRHVRVWFQHVRVVFLHKKCYFLTQSVVSTRRVWFLQAKCDFYTQSVISIHMIMILTRLSVIMTLICASKTYTSVNCTRKGCFSTHWVDFETDFS